MKHLKACVFLSAFAWAGFAQAAASLSPAPRVLILYNTFTNTPRTRIMAELALASPAPVVDFCQVTAAGGGIDAALTTCGYSLSNYCQVWDIRFNNNSGGPGTTDVDTLTTSGANNDEQLYTAFLQSGGSLYLLGDNADFHSRNTGLIQILSDLSNNGPLLYPNKGGTCCTVFPGDPLNWATTPNVLTNTNATVPGSIPLVNLGSGRPLATFLFGGSTNSANQFGFLPQDLNSNAGRVFVSLDYNMVGSGWSAALGNPYIDNTYTWLGNCQIRYSLTKTASVSMGSPISLGASFNYFICVSNSGAVPLSYTAWDTIPPCLSFVSANPAPTGGAGNYRTWTLNVPLATQSCITVTVQASSLSPCQ